MDLRYPIGHFKVNGQLSEKQIKECIDDIELAPSRLRAAVAGPVIADASYGRPHASSKPAGSRGCSKQRTSFPLLIS